MNVSEQELYCFMLRGYHVFSERISQQWVQEMNDVIDEMNAWEENRSPEKICLPVYMYLSLPFVAGSIGDSTLNFQVDNRHNV